MNQSSTPIRSMTGFGSVEGKIADQKVRMEIKALNHRFLDIKMRLPREFSAAELPLRNTLQAGFSRGSLDVKLELIRETDHSSTHFHANLALAAQYYECLLSVQKALGLKDPIPTTSITGLPDVISQATTDIQLEDAWKALEPVALAAMKKLTEMREHEGGALATNLRQTIAGMEGLVPILRERRLQCETGYRKKLREKIATIFEAHPIAETSIQVAIESRVAQELALLIDRTDIEEELTRFQGHLAHFLKTLADGGPVGRKLDFILQELSREINTLGNKAQDFSISEEVVQIKVRLEQLREQVMNLE